MSGRLHILPLGDRALTVEIADQVSEAAARRVRGFAERVMTARLAGVREVVPAFCSLTVHYDPLALRDEAPPPETVRARLEVLLSRLEDDAHSPGKEVDVPVCYGGDHGEDLAALARAHDVAPAQLVALHSAPRHFEARINGERLPHARPVLARAGSTVDFGACRHGCRAYLAVGGGFALEPVLGSRSTYLRGGFGGFRGRALKRGDLLPTGAADASLYPGLRRKLSEQRAGMAYPGWAVSERVELLTPGPYLIRFVPGRHWQSFPPATRECFVGSDYRIGSNSDRQGYRLAGPLLEPEAAIEVISAGVTFGTIQVPPDGAPIVLMANHQTAGGYPRLGEVASVDLPLLAQLPPGAPVRFQPRCWSARERNLARTREAIALQSRR